MYHIIYFVAYDILRLLMISLSGACSSSNILNKVLSVSTMRSINWHSLRWKSDWMIYNLIEKRQTYQYILKTRSSWPSCILKYNNIRLSLYTRSYITTSHACNFKFPLDKWRIRYKPGDNFWMFTWQWGLSVKYKRIYKETAFSLAWCFTWSSSYHLSNTNDRNKCLWCIIICIHFQCLIFFYNIRRLFTQLFVEVGILVPCGKMESTHMAISFN
jgi:hypothetical protein